MSPAALILALALGRPLQGQESSQKPKEVAPVSVPVVGTVNVNDYIALHARLISLEAQLKECERLRQRRHFLVRLFGAIFGRR